MIADSVKKRNRKVFDNKILFKTVAIVFLIIVLLLLFADFKIYNEKKKLIARVENYEKQIEHIRQSSQTLREEIANSNNTDYLEKIAYEQFGRARPGETEYIFIKSPKDLEPNLGSPKKSWFAWMSGAWGWIKSKF